jgi:hypothetical protein
MQSLKRLPAIATVAALLALLLAPTVSLAHERRSIADNKYDVVVGWDAEPAFEGQKNGAGIRISKAGTNPAEPVTGADRTLKVEIRQGATTRTFPLRAVFGQPGYYLADLVPTRPGDYQWTFTGAIGDDQINEQFDTADGKFDAVQPATALEFPVAQPEPAQVNADLAAAQASAQTAQTVAVLGILVAVIALAGVIVLWVSRPRRETLSVGSARRAAGGPTG